MAPRTRRSTLHRKSNRGEQDDEIENYEHHTDQATGIQAMSGRIVENQRKECAPQESEQQFSQVASKEKVLSSRVRRKLNHNEEQRSTNQVEENDRESVQESELEITQQGLSKKSRGPTYLPDLWARNPNEGRVLVNFNKKGQPIGPNKKIFTGFLGTLARNCKFTPLDVEDWRKVPQARKNELIRMVKEKFEVPKEAEHWILLSIGKKRRHWRSRVKAGSFLPTLQIENQVHNRPIRVKEDQWKNLLAYWAKRDVKETSDKNKDHRRCSVMKHTTGKLSFAEVEEELKEHLGRSPSRVEMFDACYSDLNGDPSCDEVGAALEQMKEFLSKLPPDARDPVGPSDTFSKVMGKDPRGRVRMAGLGVSPLDISGPIPSRSTCYRMVLENEAALTRMEEKLNATTRMISTLQQKIQQDTSNVSTARRPVSPNQSSNSINKFQVGDEVLLKSLFNSRKNVAKGYVRSVDPNQDVGGKRLGKNWCEVQISIPIEWDEDLIRPYSNLSTIGDATGTCIAWPCHLVSDDDDQE